jgi:hypothetical protein
MRRKKAWSPPPRRPDRTGTLMLILREGIDDRKDIR